MLTVCWLGGMGTNLAFPSISLALKDPNKAVDQCCCAYLSHYPVFIGYPLRELLDILLDPVMLGVEDVHPVLRSSDPVLV